MRLNQLQQVMEMEKLRHYTGPQCEIVKLTTNVMSCHWTLSQPVLT